MLLLCSLCTVALALSEAWADPDATFSLGDGGSFAFCLMACFHVTALLLLIGEVT